MARKGVLLVDDCSVKSRDDPWWFGVDPAHAQSGRQPEHVLERASAADEEKTWKIYNGPCWRKVLILRVLE